MVDTISVLIADDNIEYGNLLDEYISQYEDIVVKGIARDGAETIEKISQLQPDIVILDIIMPNLDGIGVLEKTAEMRLEHKPLFVVLSAIGQDVFVHRAITLGAEYYIVKPFDVEILVSRIRQVYREKYVFPFDRSAERQKPAPRKTANEDRSPNSLEVMVTGLIHNAGIPPHISGYQFLREAIMMSVDSSAVFNSITKVIYPNIAAKYNTTPRKVERAIRCAIENAWGKGGLSRNDRKSEIFVNFGKERPTNSQFISTLADKARIGMGIKLKKSEE
jgi:two-component system response regulator (stage 0 sporulation protein A)